MRDAVLSVRDLTVAMFDGAGGRRVVEGLSFDVLAGEVLAIIGESGSGKSLSMQAITGLTPSPPARVVNGAAIFEGSDLLGMTEAALGRVLGARIGMIFQEPMSALDPMRPVGDQVAETLVVHRGLTWRAARAKTLTLFERVGLSDPARRMRQRPAKLSGGMLQRVVIAAAIACRPSLIVADEPTTALDATVAAGVLDLLAEIQRETGAAMIFITHDIAVVRRIADRVLVLRHGRCIETGPVAQVLAAPREAYTARLIAASTLVSRRAEPARADLDPILRVHDLVVSFPTPSLRLTPPRLVVVGGVSLEIRSGETLALIGESGSGKTTVARAIAGLQRRDSGEIHVGGGGTVQLVFQNPQSALDPSCRAWRSVCEPLRLRGERNARRLREEAVRLMAKVGLDESYLDRFPHELSGGQRQRLGIARALSVAPDLLIADEAVSALDAETRMTVLELLVEIQQASGLPILFITHDFSVVTSIAHRAVVMKSGRVIEEGTVSQILNNPRSEYTRTLIASASFTAPVA